MNDPHNDPKMMAAAEKNMHAWAMSEEIADRALHGREIHSYDVCVTISRETGSGGSEIALRLGKKLGWNVYDKNLLDPIAEKLQCQPYMLDLVDETRSNWAYDVLGTWMDDRVVPHEKYVLQLTRSVHSLAKDGHAIFVGRGAQFLLPRDRTFAIRIVAPEYARIARIRETMHQTEAEASHYVRETEAGRREFVERFFHHDVSDPHLYDMILNSHTLGLEAAADIIANAVCRVAKLECAMA